MKPIKLYFLLSIWALFCLITSGCGFNTAMKKMPIAEFDKFSFQSNYGPVVSFDITATGAVKVGDEIEIENIDYNRTGNFTNAHIVIEGLRLRVDAGEPEVNKATVTIGGKAYTIVPEERHADRSQP